jgi:hypothetical protein
MAAASDHVLIQLLIDSVGLQRQGFGIPLILSHAAPFVARTKKYKSISAVGADFESDSPEFLAANVMFAQPVKPQFVAIGRATGSVTQRYDIGITVAQAGALYSIDVVGEGVTAETVNYLALADLTFVDGDVNTGTDVITKTAHGMTTGAGPFRLANAGGALPTGVGIAVDTNVWIIAPTADTYKLATSRANAVALTAIDITAAAGGGTHTLQRAQNDVIIAQLVQGLGDIVDANFTAVQTVGAGQTDTLRATGAANEWFSLEIIDPDIMSNIQSHAAPSDVTLADDLDAILRADSSWYCLITLYNSAAYVLAAAAFIESNGRIYVFDSCDSEGATEPLSTATDVFKQALALNLGGTMGVYHPSPADFVASAWMGGWLPTNPGQANTKFQELTLVNPVALTDDHKVNLRAKRANSYEQVVTDYAFTWEGTVFSTVFKFLDIRRNADFYQDESLKAQLGVFKANPIVRYDPDGVSLLAAAQRGVNELMVGQGVLREGAIVTAESPDDAEPTDVEERNYAGLKSTGEFAGAINTVKPITVVLTF